MLTNNSFTPAPRLPDALKLVNRGMCIGAQAHPLTGIGHMLVSLATVLQAKFVVRIKPDFYESLALLWITSADPSERKGAVDKGYRDILKDIEHCENDTSAHKRSIQMSMYKSNLKYIETMRGKLASTSDVDRDSLLRKIAEQEMLNKLPEPELQLFTQNTTYLALAKSMSIQKGNRITLFSSESDLLEDMRSKMDLLNAICKGFSGEEIQIDRVRTTESYRIPKAHMSMSVMTQDSVIKRLCASPLLWEKGLLPRMAVAFVDSVAGYRDPGAVNADSNALEWFAGKLKQLHEIPWRNDGNPHELVLSSEAYHLWVGYARQLEQEQGPISHWAPLKPWLGKQGGWVARVAALFHCVTFQNLNEPISAENMQFAIDLSEYLKPHTMKLYLMIYPDDTEKNMMKVREYLLKTTDLYVSQRMICRGTHLSVNKAARCIQNYVSCGALAPTNYAESNNNLILGFKVSQLFVVNRDALDAAFAHVM